LPHGLKNPQAGTALAASRPPSVGFCSTGRWSVADRLPKIPSLKGASPMGKGNNSQKNDKKNKKPKQDKTKTPVKK
jgi:hypothetical protein